VELALDKSYFFYKLQEMTPAMRPPRVFEGAVLLAVSRLGDLAYGISIRRELEERLRRPVSLGAVYTTLERLHDKRLLAARHGEPTPERGGRAKKLFRLTARGVEALEVSRSAARVMWSLSPMRAPR
jgi:DNA-binding PadR family transcriptional regulator